MLLQVILMNPVQLLLWNVFLLLWSLLLLRVRTREVYDASPSSVL
jgi:hypothetical protein